MFDFGYLCGYCDQKMEILEILTGAIHYLVAALVGYITPELLKIVGNVGGRTPPMFNIWCMLAGVGIMFMIKTI